MTHDAQRDADIAALLAERGADPDSPLAAALQALARKAVEARDERDRLRGAARATLEAMFRADMIGYLDGTQIFVRRYVIGSTDDEAWAASTALNRLQALSGTPPPGASVGPTPES